MSFLILLYIFLGYHFQLIVIILFNLLLLVVHYLKIFFDLIKSPLLDFLIQFIAYQSLVIKFLKVLLSSQVESLNLGFLFQVFNFLSITHFDSKSPIFQNWIFNLGIFQSLNCCYLLRINNLYYCYYCNCYLFENLDSRSDL